MIAAGYSLEPLVSHLERQLRSAGALLEILDAQLAAIKSGDVQAVMNSVFAIQTEMVRREQLEAERGRLLAEAAEHLTTTVEEVTVDALCDIAPGELGERLRSHSQALVLLLEDVGRRYHLNRDMMRQELQFLGFMLEAVGEPARTGAYGRDGAQPQAPHNPTTILDVKG